MSENDERSTDEQPDGSAPGEAEAAAGPEVLPAGAEEARDYLERIIDARVTAVYAETLPEVIESVVERVAGKLGEELKRIDPEAIAGRAADMGQERLERSAEIIKRRLHASAAAGAGGSDGRASDGGGSGGDSGGGDGGGGDLRDLEGLPDEPGRAEGPAAPRPVSTGSRGEQVVQGVLMGVSKIFEDPAAFLTSTIDAYVKIKQVRDGPQDDLQLAQGLYERKPWLFDVFGKADPLAERIPSMVARALDVGLKVGSRASPGGTDMGKALRDLVRGKGGSRGPRSSEDRPLPHQDVDLREGPAADPPPAPERGAPEPASAPAAQDLRPTRGKLRDVA